MGVITSKVTRYIIMINCYINIINASKKIKKIKTNIYNWNIQNFKVRELIISKTSIILNLPDEKNLSYFKHYFFYFNQI